MRELGLGGGHGGEDGAAIARGARLGRRVLRRADRDALEVRARGRTFCRRGRVRDIDDVRRVVRDSREAGGFCAGSRERLRRVVFRRDREHGGFFVRAILDISDVGRDVAVRAIRRIVHRDACAAGEGKSFEVRGFRRCGDGGKAHAVRRKLVFVCDGELRLVGFRVVSRLDRRDADAAGEDEARIRGTDVRLDRRGALRLDVDRVVQIAEGPGQNEQDHREGGKEVVEAPDLEIFFFCLGGLVFRFRHIPFSDPV